MSRCRVDRASAAIHDGVSVPGSLSAAVTQLAAQLGRCRPRSPLGRRRGSPRRHAGGMVTVAALGVLLTGCLGPTPVPREPVRFGTFPPVTETIPLRVPPGAVIRAPDWPSACTILTDAEIRALLPQADQIRRQPTRVVVTDLSLDIGSPFDSGGPRQETAPEGSCSYSFALVGAAIPDVRSNIDITILGLAAPTLLALAYDDELAGDRANDRVAPVTDHATGFGPEACYSKLEPSGIQFYLVCRHGPLLYEVSGLSFGLHPGLPDTTEIRRDRWRDGALIPVAARVADKVSAG